MQTINIFCRLSLVMLVFFQLSCSESTGGGGADQQSVLKITTITVNGDRPSMREGESLSAVVTIPEKAVTDVTLIWQVLSPLGRFAVETGTTVVPAGSNSARFTLTVTDNGVYNDSQFARVRVRDQDNRYAAGELAVTIVDNDPMPYVLVGDGSAVRGGRIDLEVSLSEASGEDTTVNWRTSDLTAVQGVDYVAGQGSLVIPAGATKGIISVTSLPTAAAGSFLVQLLFSDRARISDGSATAYILAGDTLDTSVSFALAQTRVTESNATVPIGVQLSNAIGQDVTVNFKVSGTAIEGEDVQTILRSLTIPAGQTTGSVLVGIIDDSIFENTESVVIEMVSSTFASFGPIVRHELIIDDNDPMPTISVYNAQATEGDTLKFFATLDHVSGADTTVSYKTVDMTATSSDYTAAAGTISIPKGSTVATIEVQTLNDSVYEVTEKMKLLLTQASGATLLQASAEGTIIDNDVMPTVQFVLANQTIPLGQNTVQVDVQLSAASGAPVSIPLNVAGTAVAGTDHNLTPSVINIPAGQTHALVNFSLFRHGPPTLEVDLQLAAPQGATLGSQTTQSIYF